MALLLVLLALICLNGASAMESATTLSEPPKAQVSHALPNADLMAFPETLHTLLSSNEPEPPRASEPIRLDIQTFSSDSNEPEPPYVSEPIRMDMETSFSSDANEPEPPHVSEPIRMGRETSFSSDASEPQPPHVSSDEPEIPSTYEPEPPSTSGSPNSNELMRSIEQDTVIPPPVPQPAVPCPGPSFSNSRKVKF